MNNKISETLKKMAICTMVLIFCFILFTPTADALSYDPEKYERKFIPILDGDPWDDLQVYEPPPPNDFDIITTLSIFILEKYDYFQFEQTVDTNNRRIIQKQSDEGFRSKTQNRRFSY